VGFSIGGARALFFINGQKVGYATGVSANETLRQIPVEALGDVYVKEHELVAVMVTMQADFVRMKASSLQEKGVWPRGTTLEMLAFNDVTMTAEIVDQTTGETIYKVDEVVAETQSWRIDKNSVLMVNASFRGIRMRDDIDAVNSQ
jgi:hypothetical protein